MERPVDHPELHAKHLRIGVSVDAVVARKRTLLANGGLINKGCTRFLECIAVNEEAQLLAASQAAVFAAICKARRLNFS